MGKDSVVNVRSGGGAKKVNFEDDFSIDQFMTVLARAVGMQKGSIAVKVGFPPALISAKSLQQTVTELGIRDREVLIVEEN
jgi:hypothetical protein